MQKGGSEETLLYQAAKPESHHLSGVLQDRVCSGSSMGESLPSAAHDPAGAELQDSQDQVDK